MSHWICETCGHNSSQHRHEWNKFRGVWNTACKAGVGYSHSGRNECKCAKFMENTEEEMA